MCVCGPRSRIGVCPKPRSVSELDCVFATLDDVDGVARWTPQNEDGRIKGRRKQKVKSDCRQGEKERRGPASHAKPLLAVWWHPYGD